jgi:hypothetical protein
MKIFGEIVRPKYKHIYGKFQINHIRISGKLISTVITLFFYQVVIVWRNQ